MATYLHPTFIALLIFIITFYTIGHLFKLANGQVILLPPPHVADPFKDNPKWSRFKLEQIERIEQLKVLVDNVWNLLDELPNPSPSFNFKESFIKFHFQAFIDFFQQTEHQLHTQSVYLTINTAIGIQNITSLYEVNRRSRNSENADDPLTKLRLKWIELHGMTQTIHTVFNQTSNNIFTIEPSSDNIVQIFEIMEESFPIWFSGGSDEGNGTIKNINIQELADNIDKEMISSSNENHLLRGLVLLLHNMEQANIDMNETLNYFCYGNNRFGVLPDLIDIVSNTALYLTTVDMKKLVLDIYSLTYSTFYGNRIAKDDLIAKRVKIWTDLIERIDHKINFTYLDGDGWKYADGPIVFTCDLPPSTGHEHHRQWGRNITMGAKPNASLILENQDPQAGPFRSDGAIGYYDDRSPEMNYVAFERTYQGYIEAELVLNPNGNCVGTCPDYHKLSPLCNNNDDYCTLFKNYHCKPNEPNCLMKSCRVAKNCVRTSSTVQLCSSANSTKIDWINFNNNDKIFSRQNVSNDQECNEENGQNLSTAIERWEMFNGIIMAAPMYCELCLCTCMSSDNEDDQDYFDLQPALADIENGYVISAIKFVKEGHVIRLAIEEGKPQINGNIDEMTVKWVEPNPFDLKDPNKTVPLGSVGHKNGFTKLNFNVLVGEPGNVLTGIRFVVDETQALNLEIQVTPITWDDKEAKRIHAPASLIPTESKWISSSSTTTTATRSDNSTRQPLQFTNPINNPIRQKGPSMPDSVTNAFVEFTITSYETDLGQSIVPFFDAQSTYYYYEGKSWLRGAGLMHKGKPDSSGFITPLIIAAKPNSIIKYLPKGEETTDK